MIIGHHILYGKIQSLERPLVSVERVDGPGRGDGGQSGVPGQVNHQEKDNFQESSQTNYCQLTQTGLAGKIELHDFV